MHRVLKNNIEGSLQATRHLSPKSRANEAKKIKLRYLEDAQSLQRLNEQLAEYGRPMRTLASLQKQKRSVRAQNLTLQKTRDP